MVGLLYTAQEVARFCEVDLKTVHHWAERGKIPHFRTEGRHLRFRRNDVVRFLRALDYPMPEALVAERPSVALAIASSTRTDLARRLSARFDVRKFEGGAVAIAHLMSDQPDALVVATEDPTLAGARTVAALKAAPETAWILVAAIAPDDALDDARAAGAEVALCPRDAGKLPSELARALAV